MESWKFLPNPGKEEEGLGHAGIETFKGSPFPGIARECSQNSLDASANAADEAGNPVHLVFRLHSVRASEIPGMQALKKTLDICLHQATARNIKKDVQFFERAVKVARETNIPVLTIEDYGTTGLIGPPTEGTPFHALVKSSGVSQKSNNDAGGSFGIGKNAAFAISSLRTVFYSTLYKDGYGKKYLAQGKSILVSHDNECTPLRATGYWGAEDYYPVENSNKVPEWLRRSAIGTTVASIGFIEEENWHWQMTESLIRNFFSAINNKAIHFTVIWSNNESIEINHSSLQSLFIHPEIRRASENTGTTDDLDFSSAMLEALRSPDSERYEETIDDAGRFRLTLLQKNALPRRMGILRNGMYITDNLRHFGHPMSRFPLSRDFVAVLEPADRLTSGKIRDMESPRHDEISAERIDDIADRNRRKVAMKKVGSWIRERIKSATTKPAEAEILLDEMNRFFSRPSSGPSMPDPANNHDDPERIKFSPRKTTPKPPVGSGDQGNSGSSGGQKQTKSGGGRTTGEHSGRGRGTAGGRGGKSIPYSFLRNSLLSSSQGLTRRVSFTPNDSGTALLELSAIGISNDEALAVQSINGTQCGMTPKIELKKGERVHLDIELKSPYTGPISMVLTPAEESLHAN